MNRLIVIFLFGVFWSSAGIAADQYTEWLTDQNQRGAEIEYIRVANEKPLLETGETDQEVAGILEEVEAIEQDVGDYEEAEESL